jgi:hypothetical protein
MVKDIITSANFQLDEPEFNQNCAFKNYNAAFFVAAWKND